ncbi:integrase [Methylobacterium sp. Leaf123]|uniref:tyrosine-type recombinase/integrase n=1 Tax=Methylobacterium sp. Leaf123 TaxID=1736264 RepID=UPI0006F48EA4|nr:site-specific integrase [Methylobacterium sp. Leaf123]KQQ13538.1 integrase [Methylobacterium sp. Leaf123]
MPRAVDKLNARSVATVTAPGRYGDGGGLYLQVDPSGAKRWLLIFRSQGRQREMGLGGLGSVSLADARRRRDEARRLLAEGRDPIDARCSVDSRQPAAISFGAFADQLIPELSKGFRNDKHAAQWTSTLATYASSLRAKPIAEISTDDLLAVLRPIWLEKAETASRVRGRIERILDAAKAQGLREGENPARWRGHLLPKRRRLTRGHHAAVPFNEMPAFCADLRKRTGVAALALEFAILTAARSGEVRGATWAEIDIGKNLWVIPGERMKAGREHRVPLVARAVEILDAVAPLRRGDLVFPSFRADRPLSDMAFSALLTRMGCAATAHAFRSSFRDWAGEATATPREVAEAALAHAVGDAVELAYRRGDALEKRRALMDAWAAFLAAPTGGAAIPFRPAGAA